MRRTDPESTIEPAFAESLLSYVRLTGKSMEERMQPCHAWIERRRELGIYPYGKVLMDRVGHTADVGDEFCEQRAVRINFGSQDYLALAQDPSLRDAARAVLDEFGVHSAGSPVLCGRTRLLVELEQKISRILGQQACLIYATAWGAGFGMLAGLVRGEDVILMDALSHNCLHEGARHATPNVCKFAHNDLADLESLLREERTQRPNTGIFIVLESLYSMDSDAPELVAVLRLAREWEAIVILDVAHDFGAMGERGLGLLETTTELQPDVIMGSFSKTFAANGGFVACSRAVRDYLCNHSSPYVFSNAISPLQTAVVSRAFDIVFSEDGQRRRAALRMNTVALRAALRKQGIEVTGVPSPIVPAFVGDEKIARLTSKHLLHNGLLANLVEFPAVPAGKARFRFQVMANHESAAIEKAAAIMAQSKAQAETEWATISNGA